jgi:putative Ca2+/H+ antiporter (TMEM165/GDT1 family)
MEGLLTVIISIFLAELGDKTQLAPMAFASKYGWKTAFLGALLGLTFVNLIGAVLGDRIGKCLPIGVVQKGAGTLFILFGILMLAGKL